MARMQSQSSVSGSGACPSGATQVVRSVYKSADVVPVVDANLPKDSPQPLPSLPTKVTQARPPKHPPPPSLQNVDPQTVSVPEDIIDPSISVAQVNVTATNGSAVTSTVARTKLEANTIPAPTRTPPAAIAPANSTPLSPPPVPAAPVAQSSQPLAGPGGPDTPTVPMNPSLPPQPVSLSSWNVAAATSDGASPATLTYRTTTMPMAEGRTSPPLLNPSTFPNTAPLVQAHPTNMLYRPRPFLPGFPAPANNVPAPTAPAPRGTLPALVTGPAVTATVQPLATSQAEPAASNRNKRKLSPDPLARSAATGPAPGAPSTSAPTAPVVLEAARRSSRTPPPLLPPGGTNHNTNNNAARPARGATPPQSPVPGIIAPGPLPPRLAGGLTGVVGVQQAWPTLPFMENVEVALVKAHEQPLTFQRQVARPLTQVIAAAMHSMNITENSYLGVGSFVVRAMIKDHSNGRLLFYETILSYAIKSDWRGFLLAVLEYLDSAGYDASGLYSFEAAQDSMQT